MTTDLILWVCMPFVSSTRGATSKALDTRHGMDLDSWLGLMEEREVNSGKSPKKKKKKKK